MIRTPTRVEVAKLCEHTGEGVMLCNRILRRYFIHKAIVDANSFEDLKEILLALHPEPSLGHTPIGDIIAE